MNLPCFNLISLVDAAYGTARYGRMHRIRYFITSAFNGYDVEKILRRYGVRVWGRERDDVTRSLLVKQNQAEWAEYVLCRAGVPLAGELLNPRNADYADMHADSPMPAPWSQNGIGAISAVDHLVDWMAKIVG